MVLKPLTLEDLIGAPLRAIVKGQEAATQATADFISLLGFESVPEKETVVRNFEFNYLHPVPDPSNPGGIIETPTRLRVPLLSMFPVPNLRISEATVTFAANIVEARSVRRPRPVVSVDQGAVREDFAALQLSGVYAPTVSSPGQSGPTLSISMKVTTEPASEGLARVLNVLSDAITSAPASK